MGDAAFPQAGAEQLALFQAMVELTRDAVLVIDHQGLLHHANHSALKIFQYKADELLGKNVSVRPACPPGTGPGQLPSPPPPLLPLLPPFFPSRISLILNINRIYILKSSEESVWSPPPSSLLPPRRHGAVCEWPFRSALPPPSFPH